MEEFDNKKESQSEKPIAQKKRKKHIERPFSATGVPEIMDIKELSSYLGIGKSKIYAMISGKKIPASKIGRQYRFYKILVDKWLQEKLITTDSVPLPLFDPARKDRGEDPRNF